MNKNLLYRRIPKVDVLLEDEKIRELTEQYSYDTVLEAVREELEKLRPSVTFTNASSCFKFIRMLPFHFLFRFVLSLLCCPYIP